MDWVVPVSTAITGAVSLLTLRLANRHADKMAERQARENRERLRFDAQERRYEDRRDAVIKLDEVAEHETDRIVEVENDPRTGASPGDIYDEYRFPDLTAAHARVVMLATPEVVQAADELRGAVVAAFHGEKGHWGRYGAAIAAYRTASRAMLTYEEPGQDAPNR